jgi:hypothetical protein
MATTICLKKLRHAVIEAQITNNLTEPSNTTLLCQYRATYFSSHETSSGTFCYNNLKT